MLIVDVVDAIEIVLVRGTGGTSRSSLALLNEFDVSETLELGLERLAVDNRGAFLVVLDAVLLRGSGFAFIVPLALTGEVGETTVFETELATSPRRMVDAVDLTDGAKDFGLAAAELSAPTVALCPGTFLED